MKYGLIAAGVVLVLVVGFLMFAFFIANPRVVRELREEPNGERARKVMLITLPSGRTIPVNYLRERSVVYAGSDGGWSRELRGAGAQVQLLVRGETLTGHARAIEDDPDLRAAVFLRLRPTALKFAGTLVQIDLAQKP